MPYETFLDTHSSPRSGVYKRVFRTQTHEETGGAVLWGQAMSMAIMLLMQSFEIALRNRIHVSLSRQATLRNGSTADSYAWYDHQLGNHQLQGETYDKVERLLCDRQRIRLQRQPTPDQVVARLPFGVWPNILEQQLPTAVVEAKTFMDVFPYYPRKPRKHWSHADNRKAAVDRVKDVNAWRNRVAHCRPVWSEGWFKGSQSQHWSDVLHRVKGRRAGVLEILGWICPQTVQVYAQSFGGRLFDELATDHSVFAHLTHPYVPTVGPSYPVADVANLAAYRARP